MHETPFTPILRTMVSRVPEAVGAVFADWEGETVDRFPDPEREEAPPLGRPGEVAPSPAWDLRLFGAHWGVILNHVQAALRTFHYGDPRVVMLHHDALEILMEAVSDRYFLLLAVRTGGPLGVALQQLALAASELRKEV